MDDDDILGASDFVDGRLISEKLTQLVLNISNGAQIEQEDQDEMHTFTATIKSCLR